MCHRNCWWMHFYKSMVTVEPCSDWESRLCTWVRHSKNVQINSKFIQITCIQFTVRELNGRVDVSAWFLCITNCLINFVVFFSGVLTNLVDWVWNLIWLYSWNIRASFKINTKWIETAHQMEYLNVPLTSTHGHWHFPVKFE